MVTDDSRIVAEYYLDVKSTWDKLFEKILILFPEMGLEQLIVITDDIYLLFIKQK